MARAQFYDVGIDSQGNAITTTQVTVYLRGTTTTIALYENESGSTPKSNPFNATTGFISFWVEPGEYDIKIEDTNSPASFTTRTIGWSSIPHTDGVYYQSLAKDDTGPGYSCFSSIKSSSQTVSNGNSSNPAIIRFDDVVFDLGDVFDSTASTYKFIAPSNGIYQFNVNTYFQRDGSATFTYVNCWARVNGTIGGSSQFIGALMHSTAGFVNRSFISELESGDYMQAVCWVAGGIPTVLIGSSDFSGHLIARTS